MTTDPLAIYTDGTCVVEVGQGYGWVAQHAPAGLSSSKIVRMPTKANGPYLSNVMESAAIVDALSEFADLNMHLLVHSDSRALTRLMGKHRRRGPDTSYLLNNPDIISFKDGLRLSRLMDTVSFEIVWVKAHGDCFPNLVIDQALRTALAQDEAAALDFITEAMESRSALVWGSWLNEDGESYSGYHRVEDATDAMKLAAWAARH